jgi:hypothetical protein
MGRVAAVKADVRARCNEDRVTPRTRRSHGDHKIGTIGGVAQRGNRLARSVYAVTLRWLRRERVPDAPFGHRPTPFGRRPTGSAIGVPDSDIGLPDSDIGVPDSDIGVPDSDTIRRDPWQRPVASTSGESTRDCDEPRQDGPGPALAVVESLTDLETGVRERGLVGTGGSDAVPVDSPARSV